MPFVVSEGGHSGRTRNAKGPEPGGSRPVVPIAILDVLLTRWGGPDEAVWGWGSSRLAGASYVAGDVLKEPAYVRPKA